MVWIHMTTITVTLNYFKLLNAKRDIWRSLKGQSQFRLIHTFSASDAIDESTNSVDPGEDPQYEPPHQGLHCLSYSLCIFNMIQLHKPIIENLADVNLPSDFWRLKSWKPVVPVVLLSPRSLLKIFPKLKSLLTLETPITTAADDIYK